MQDIRLILTVADDTVYWIGNAIEDIIDNDVATSSPWHLNANKQIVVKKLTIDSIIKTVHRRKTEELQCIMENKQKQKQNKKKNTK